jgi:hypothetical protein
MNVICEKCEYEPAVHFYRNYRGPHAVCDVCYREFVRSIKERGVFQVYPSSKEAYVEEVLIDEVMNL